MMTRRELVQAVAAIWPGMELLKALREEPEAVIETKGIAATQELMTTRRPPIAALNKGWIIQGEKVTLWGEDWDATLEIGPHDVELREYQLHIACFYWEDDKAFKMLQAEDMWDLMLVILKTSDQQLFWGEGYVVRAQYAPRGERVRTKFVVQGNGQVFSELHCQQK